MAEMERKPSLKERAFERLGISGLRQKAVSGDSHLTPGILLPTTISASVHNGQSGSNKPPITVSLIRDFRPISPDQEMPQGPSERKKKRPKPLGTIEYQVVGSDTLESIAAQFDTTPSELAKLNKLPSRMIFPGQDIYVPDPNHDSGSELSVSPPQFSPPSPSPPTVDNKPRMDIPIVKMSDRPPVRYPGHVERQTSTSSQPEVTDFAARKLPEEEARELDKECYQRFIKVNVKHITDGQGVVNGVLLVTPNAIMFDPNVSDPLVIENGPEMYGMMAAMDTVISAAMYHDIAAMKLKGQPEERTDSPRPEIYHSSSCLYHQAEQAKKRCYKGNNSELIDMIKTDRSESESSTGSDKCSCGANANIAKVHSEQLPREVKSAQSEASIMSASSGMNQSDQSLSEMDLIEKEVRMLVNDVVKRAIESETRISGTSSDVSVRKIDSENNQISEPLHFVDDTFASSVEKESTLKHLQDNLKQLELESSECTFNSSGTGTLADASGETSLYTTCTAQLSANITDDSLLESPECIEKDSHQLSESQTEFVSTNDSGKNSESTPNHPNKMQIGSIQYFQYSSVDDNGLIIGPDGQPIALVRQPSKSDPIPMPDVNKGETNEGRSSSFGSFTSSPHISAFVNYATGLFRNTADDHKLVKDISEGPHGESDIDGNTGSHNSLVTKSEELESSDKHVAVKNAVKMGDMPGLFQSIDSFILQISAKLIPRPAARVEDPPLYLCLRVGRPLHQRVHSTGPIESYSRKKKKPEYWFSIPRDKVDQLYAFFVQWSPDKYGDEEDIDPASRGFVVVDEDDDVADDEALDIFDEYFGPSTSARIHRDWEIVTKDEFRRRSIDVYEPLPLPELIGKSAILQEEHISLISRSLPGRAVGYPWTLVYSTETNGFSLKTLYRNMLGLEGPILLVVEDTSHNVFGALVACPLTISEHFYGTGESFLFTFYPEFDVFKWTGENNFFIKGNKDSLAIGAGKGQFGLWFDEDLYHGHSNRCETYDNDPLTSPEDFVLKGLEAWAFMV